jgi:hypothetical protein
MWMPGLIVYADVALTAVANDLLDRLDRPIEKVHLLALDRKPATANNSRPPAADLSHPSYVRVIDQALYDLKQAFDVQPDALAEVKADVIVGGRMRRAGRPRAAKRDGDDAGERGESG